VAVRDSKETLWDDEVEVGDDGRLAFTADAVAMSPLEIEATCLGGDGQ